MCLFCSNFIFPLRVTIFVVTASIFYFTLPRTVTIQLLLKALSVSSSIAASELISVDFISFWERAPFLSALTDWVTFGHLLNIMNTIFYRFWILSLFLNECYFFCFSKQLPWLVLYSKLFHTQYVWTQFISFIFN